MCGKGETVTERRKTAHRISKCRNVMRVKMTEYRKKEVRIWKCGDVTREEMSEHRKRSP
jgi:hypothetical protein